MMQRLVRVSDDPEVDLFVAEYGKPTDPALLVIHGGPDWDHSYLLDPLTLLTGHRLIFVDLRGCGRSTRGLGDAAYTPAAATDDLVALIAALEIETLDVLGFSYGGLLAQRLLVAAPTRVRRLIVASSSVLPISGVDESPPAFQGPWTPEMTRDLARRSAAHDVWNAERRAAYLERLNHVRFSAEWAGPWLRGALPSPRIPEAPQLLAELEKPILLLQGRFDTTFPVDLVEPTLARLPNATSVVLDEAGHMAHVDQSEEWLQAVGAFVDQR